MENPENAWTWQEIINSLRNRWINDIIFACVDWLKWFKWAILSNFPNAIIQPCIVHKIRNLQKLISYKDRYEFNLEFKKVYNAISEEEALLELNKMNIKWQKYSHILRDWFYDIDVWWQYFKYSYRIRKLIYTTNIIENLNWIIQTNIAKRRVYFTHKSAEISIFLAIQNKQNSLKKISLNFWVNLFCLNWNCFFIILSFIIIACNKPKKVVEEAYPDNSPKVEKYYIEKESSKELVKEIRYYPNNKIQMEGKYKNNKRNGDWIYYFENGTIWCEGSFLDGVDHGQRIVYYENGQKALKDAVEKLMKGDGSGRVSR